MKRVTIADCSAVIFFAGRNKAINSELCAYHLATEGVPNCRGLGLAIYFTLYDVIQLLFEDKAALLSGECRRLFTDIRAGGDHCTLSGLTECFCDRVVGNTNGEGVVFAP